MFCICHEAFKSYTWGVAFILTCGGSDFVAMWWHGTILIQVTTVTVHLVYDEISTNNVLTKPRIA